MNSGIWNVESILEEYKDLRGDLSKLGIGNGPSGILPGEGESNLGGEKHWTKETIKIWVWCWEDIVDFGLSSGQGSGGGSTSTIPDFWPDMQELQECFSVNDVFDIDPQSGGNADASFTGDVEMCTLWNTYLSDCLSTDFEGVSASSYFTPYQHHDSPYAIWAELKHDYPELFNEIINNEHGCFTTDQAEDLVDNGNDTTTDTDNSELIECVDIAYKEFITAYGLELTKFEESEIKNAAIASDDCGKVDCLLVEAYGNSYIENIENSNDCTGKYIEDLKNIFDASNCDLKNFSNAYRDYFGITESTEEQTVPTIGINDVLCENMFTVTSVEDDLHVSAGVSALNFQVVNSDGITLSVSHPYLQIMMAEDIGACAQDYTHESIMAESVNAAITEIETLMVNFPSYEALNESIDFGDNSIIDDAFQKILFKNIWDIYYNCGASPSGGPLLSNNTEWGDKCNTIYNQLSENNINDCN
ncbi:MAG: hypothetical protein ACJATI_005580 [Halioglobus sp.]|jgi:hypothetical protein